ncbi:hypothetical protein B5V88_10455 [Heyndrickxia sporothermodurans]|uniref:CopG family transcriptional regulator n=1 Tax=Heyndrickxia sporothermodurans TaxID=46224 RepID=A0AB37HG99_9BACI|nr:hypothetical protein [Heyndrickxia sporothermodurans]MBL5769392.1 hypothetical protein [Heyndrickxia sporothermodurans]MBL5772291.1 hypothetical protein [Heyndrickxia sporothermodurans]MBL5775842.1 hypothetical protein [Heyndrickxia sporothermodurans]MBL5779366.1 hypothetical protein [Heyndrickxia sporothermodurans]MBL5782440.1 hypothetical protein [Heyndrickxia sporothermodurans]
MPNAKFTISLLPSDQDLIRFIDEKKKTQSFSAYIRDLIREDMSRNQEISNLEQIYEYVEKRLHESGFAIKDATEGKMKEIVDEVDKELIMNLF